MSSSRGHKEWSQDLHGPLKERPLGGNGG